MKKNAFLLLAVIGLGACSTPPDPVPFPTKAKDSNIDSFVFRDTTPKVPLNRLDVKEWHYAMITHGLILNETQKTKFWYLAHHATDIELIGNITQADDLRRLMIASGVTAKIIVNPSYAKSNTVSVKFSKYPIRNKEQKNAML